MCKGEVHKVALSRFFSSKMFGSAHIGKWTIAERGIWKVSYQKKRNRIRELFLHFRQYGKSIRPFCEHTLDEIVVENILDLNGMDIMIVLDNVKAS